MAIVLDLPPEMEGTLAQEAQRQGTTPENLILSGMRLLYPTPVDDDQARRHTALTEIIARAQALSPIPSSQEDKTLVGEAIEAKFRRQGFQL